MGTESNPPPTVREVTDLRPVFALLEKPELAEFYARLKQEPATIPELLPALSIGKTAAYNYVAQLEKAGLVSKAGTKDNSTLYAANDFTIALTIAGKELEVTPELARVLAERETNSEVDRFLDQYGIATLAEFIELAHAYAEGEMTHRAIADILDISRAAAFDMLEEVLDILDIVPPAKHSQPGDRSDDEVETLIENARRSE